LHYIECIQKRRSDSNEIKHKKHHAHIEEAKRERMLLQITFFQKKGCVMERKTEARTV
jgi:hypothetical protein